MKKRRKNPVDKKLGVIAAIAVAGALAYGVVKTSQKQNDINRSLYLTGVNSGLIQPK